MRQAGRRLLDTPVDLLARAGVNPSVITISGLAVTGVAAWLAWSGSWAASAVVLAAGSVTDALDGGVARRRDMVTRAGAVLDSTCDRVGEFMMFFALLTGAAARECPSVVYLSPLALGGSFMVSYTRARSEGVGIPCTSGLFTRTERLVLLIAALVVTAVYGGAQPVAWMLVIVSAGSWLTALHRLVAAFGRNG